MTSDERIQAYAKEIEAVAPNSEVGGIVLDVATHIGDTAGELSNKVLAEIANAYLQGALDGARFRSEADVRAARRLVQPIIARDINRVS